MNIPCPTAINCVCFDSLPIYGFSAEPPDAKYFVGRGYTGVVPPLGQTWGVQTCQTIAQSATSQQAADLAAAEAGIICVVSTFQNPSVFPNMQQSASVTCPDGNLFTYTVPAGALVSSSSQLDANTQALSLAQKNAGIYQICLGSLGTTSVCPGTAISVPVVATGNNLAVAPQTNTWKISSGSLPPGVTLSATSTSSNNVNLVGTPNTIGSYTFSIQITDPIGNTMAKSYTFGVAGISNINSLTPYIKNSFYSQQLTAVGMTNPTYALVSGSLPTGLTLSSGGVVSGTPTATGAFSFGVTITDSVTSLQCTSTGILTNAYCTQPAEVTPASSVLPYLTYQGITTDGSNVLVIDSYNPNFLNAVTFNAAKTATVGPLASSGINNIGHPCRAANLSRWAIPVGSIGLRYYDSTLLVTTDDGVAFSGGNSYATTYNANNTLIYCTSGNYISFRTTSPKAEQSNLYTGATNKYWMGLITFNTANTYAWVGYNDRSAAGKVGWLYNYSVAANGNLVYYNTLKVPQGGSGTLVSCAYYCPDTNYVYVSYQKFGTGAGSFIGVFNASTLVNILELPVTDASGIGGVFPDVAYMFLAAYNPASRVLAFCFGSTIQFVCVQTNTLLTPITGTTCYQICYSPGNQQFYFLDDSGTGSVLRSYQ